jgi:acetamidase/formamidase
MKKHVYRPKLYYSLFGKELPVLTIAPGDSVTTSTVDAHGFDNNLEQVASRSNPLTGPFYIETAEPGDMLVVDLESLLPNRNTGWSSSVISHDVVDPSYVKELDEKDYVEWNIDCEKKIVTIARADIGIHHLSFPLQPMLGCIGVAPVRGQKVSSMTSAEHGGNMDYWGFREGVRVYLPVFSEGALLFVGDGHAIQGEGELGGSGVEVSFNVRFSVNIIKNRQIGWPRGENSNYIFTVGNARPLMNAVQHATTEMIRWLKSEYNLDKISVSLLMSQCVEFDLGNVFDPAYTAVCKIPKSYI